MEHPEFLVADKNRVELRGVKHAQQFHVVTPAPEALGFGAYAE